MRWRVTFDHGTAFVEGPKNEARRRLAACGDPAAIWTARRRAWATSTGAARKLLDQLDARRVSAIVEDTAQHALDTTATEAANLLPERGLW